MQLFAADMTPLSEPASFPPTAATEALGGAPAVGSGVRRLAGLADDLTDALPDAADILLLPPALADLDPRPLYCRAPDAKLPGGLSL